jgi:putative ATP-dependent endonuclease of OLD family
MKVQGQVNIPAVKDAGDEAIEARNTAFTRLIDRAVRANLKIDERLDKIRQSAKAEIDGISADHQKILGSLANKIETEYQKFNSAESKLHLEWAQFEGKNLQITLPPVQLEVSDDLIRNSISKFGHGTQRNYLMALLMVSATYDFSSLQTVIVGCEEPELYQHPPQAKILASALHALASNQTQIILATHSPYFITAKSFESIRVIRRTLGQKSKAYQWSVDENCSLIAKAKGEDAIGAKAARALLNQFLQPHMNEMFFAPGIILVEGEEDRALIGKYFELSGRHDQLLATGASIVPVSGKGNFINALSIARGFEIPFFAVFDGDMNADGDAKDANIKLNKDILAILEFDSTGKDGTIVEDMMTENFCVWKNSIQGSFEDGEAWRTEKVAVANEFGWKLDRLKKNVMVLEAALERLHKEKPVSHLEQLCSKIIEHFKIKMVEASL